MSYYLALSLLILLLALLWGALLLYRFWRRRRLWHEAQQTPLPESWHQALHPGRHNVILHELAHILDFEEGHPDGIPPLPRSFIGSWKTTPLPTKRSSSPSSPSSFSPVP